MHLCVPVGLTVLIAVASASSADIINVPDDQPTIQAGIDAAVDGDEVVVAPGANSETINFLGKSITLRSAEGPDVTIIDGSGIGGPVVHCTTGEGTDTVLDGFTIRCGTWSGMIINAASPAVIGCVFQDNWNGQLLFGGGMTVHSGAPTITSCTFLGNEGGSAGGLLIGDLADVIVMGCSFIGNFSETTGAGGMYISGSATVKNCLFSENSTCNQGGGLFVAFSSPTIANCVFTANTAFAGGAIACTQSEPLFVNCSIYCNTAEIVGGVFNSPGSSVLVNCTMYGNASKLAGISGGMYSGGDSIPRLHNCIVRNNTPPQMQDDAGALTTVTYSNIEAGWTGVGSHNIDADPLFVEPENGNLRLSPGSPCIDAADNTSVPKGVVTDLDGNPRFVDDPDTKDTGNGDPPIVDMGTYEFQVLCAADLTGDAIVGPADLAIILGNWGPVPPGDPIADLNDDGIVGPADLAIVLGNWGACP